MTMNNNSLPISTQWLMDSTDIQGQEALSNVFLVYSGKTSNKGTGFLIESGQIITNWHVIDGCPDEEIIIVSSVGEKFGIRRSISDSRRDLAILIPDAPLVNGLSISTKKIMTETKVITWGHPLAYNGPAPILSVGYIAGFNEYSQNPDQVVVKRYVINGAFNPGNSGGPLFADNSNEVIGVVVAKHSPIPVSLTSALQALSNQKSGFQYSAADEKGNIISFSEAQLVAELLKYQRKMTQVMLGEAIAAEELVNFLEENNF